MTATHAHNFVHLITARCYNNNDNIGYDNNNNYAVLLLFILNMTTAVVVVQEYGFLLSFSGKGKHTHTCTFSHIPYELMIAKSFNEFYPPTLNSCHPINVRQNSFVRLCLSCNKTSYEQ